MPAARTAKTSFRLTLATLVLALAWSCASAPTAQEITRDRAIAIARSQVRWQPFESVAVKGTSSGRRIWRVTLKGRLPDQPPLLFETTVVEIDALTGAVVSVAKT